eukprot:TRINITY_DN4329_c0_g1_i1.p1 TRINITY_DN4329_c0_g1~~TRINITY_DN4329_c0_g1_i1.p1  ORF type:complete len:226 (+),score=32.49 TRINITY_DN4329_c0_g1_i1:162-839(+)
MMSAMSVPKDYAAVKRSYFAALNVAPPKASAQRAPGEFASAARPRSISTMPSGQKQSHRNNGAGASPWYSAQSASSEADMSARAPPHMPATPAAGEPMRHPMTRTPRARAVSTPPRYTSNLSEELIFGNMDMEECTETHPADEPEGLGVPPPSPFLPSSPARSSDAQKAYDNSVSSSYPIPIDHTTSAHEEELGSTFVPPHLLVGKDNTFSVYDHRRKKDACAGI